MQQFPAALSNRFSSRRRRSRQRDATTAGEVLEDRQLLAVAGISTDVAALTIRESTAAAFQVCWEPTGNGSADSVGMNLRIHYNSDAVAFDNVDAVFAAGLSAWQDVAETSDRDDGDAATDRVCKVLWLDLDGNWPDTASGTPLLTFHFTTQLGFGSSVIHLDATSVADVPLPRRDVSLTQDVRPLITTPTGTNSAVRPVFQWMATPGASGYEVWLKNLSTSQNPYAQVTVPTNMWQPTADLDLGRYRVWVQAIYPDSTRTGWSDQQTFEVASQPKNLLPVGNVTTSTPLLDWDAVTGAARYDVWVNSVTTGQSQIIRNQNVTSDEYQVAAALPLGTYLAWVQPINAQNFRGTWSAPARFTVATPPDLLTPRFPTFDTTPTFSWSPVFSAATYDLWVRNVTTGQDQVIRQPGLTGTSYTTTTPLTEAKYLWWVQATSSGGVKSLWGGGRFSVGGIPEELSPAGTTVDRTPQFTWTPVDGAVRYDLWVDRIAHGAQYIRQPNLVSPAWTPTVAMPPGSYRFWVRALSTGGTWSLWSEVQSLSIV